MSTEHKIATAYIVQKKINNTWEDVFPCASIKYANGCIERIKHMESFDMEMRAIKRVTTVTTEETVV